MLLDEVYEFASLPTYCTAKQALLQRDFASFNDVEEYKSLLMQITMTNKPAPKRLSTNQTNKNQKTDRHGRPIKCKACAGNHYLNQCKNDAKKAELKSRDLLFSCSNYGF